MDHSQYTDLLWAIWAVVAAVIILAAAVSGVLIQLVISDTKR